MNTRSIFYIMFLSVISYMTYKSIEYSKEVQTYKSEISEINDIKYGLLSVHEWKYQIDDILFKKIDEFYLDESSRYELKKKVEDL